MDSIMYEIARSNLNGAKGIEGYIDFFDPKRHKISDFKLLFILPNGKCLFMPYAQKDKKDRKQNEYAHIVYLTNALDLILRELEKQKKEFITKYIRKFDVDDITGAILELKIPFFYDTGNKDEDGNDIDDDNRYTIFEKSIGFTEKQEKALLSMKESFQKEQYKIAIQVFPSDNKINWKMEGLELYENDEDERLNWILLDNDNSVDVEVFYKIINVSRENHR